MLNKLISTNLTLTDANLYGGVSYSRDINPDNDFMYGCIASGSIEFTIDNSDNKAESLINTQFTWQCKMNGDTTYKTMGLFTVANIKKNRNKATLTAYDNVYALEASADSWLASLTFPKTLKELTNSMTVKTSITIRLPEDSFSSFTVNQNFITNNVSYRQILSFIGQLTNRFFVATTTGAIEGQRYTTSATVIDNSKYISLTVDENAIDPIDRLQIQSTHDDIGYVAGTGTNTYIITENPLVFSANKATATTTLATNLLNGLKTITYTPMKFSTFNDYGVDVGNILTINGKTCYVMKKTVKASGCEFECVGNKRRETQKTEQHSAITALNNKTNELVRTVDETKSTITSIQGSITNIEDEQGNITSQMATITTEQSEIKQTAQGLTSTVSSIQTSLQNLDGEVDTLSSTVSTVQQTADSLTTTVNQQGQTISQVQQTANGLNSTVTQQGETISQIRQDLDKIDISGYVTFTDLKTSGSTTINGSNITTGYISANRISGGTIDADTINVNNLNASNLTKGLINANRISDANNYLANLYATNVYTAVNYAQTVQLVNSGSSGLENYGTLLKSNGVYIKNGGSTTLLATWQQMADGGATTTKTAVFG